jgi:hypothetical protein
MKEEGRGREAYRRCGSKGRIRHMQNEEDMETGTESRDRERKGRNGPMNGEAGDRDSYSSGRMGRRKGRRGERRNIPKNGMEKV